MIIEWIDCCDWEPKQNSIISRGGKISHKSIFFVVDIGGDFGVPLSVEVFMVQGINVGWVQMQCFKIKGVVLLLFMNISSQHQPHQIYNIFVLYLQFFNYYKNGKCRVIVEVVFVFTQHTATTEFNNHFEKYIIFLLIFF